MTTEVETFFKPPPIDCGCGCGATGVARVKPWRDGTVCVKRGCKCNHCRGLRSKRSGQRAQAKASNLLGVPRSGLRPGHEEFMGGPVRFEHKSGAQAGPVLTRFLASEKQSGDARAIGDDRPFVATFSHDGRIVAVFDLEDGPQVVAGLADAFGMVS